MGSGFPVHCVKKAPEAEFNPQAEVLLSFDDFILFFFVNTSFPAFYVFILIFIY